MLKVGNTCDPFSQEWDDLLKVLLKKGTVTESSKYTLNFRLLVNVRTYFGFFKFKEYATYEVWVSNKISNYATLMKKNEKHQIVSHKPSQETMDELYLLEKKVRSKSSDYPYSLPEV
ncbi:MAG: hypothetical protein ACRC6R_08020 [Bacteroidales bacterium]